MRPPWLSAVGVRLRARGALLVTSGALLSTCGATPDAGELARLQAGLVHAAPSPADEDAVVVLTRAAFSSWCTGTVVAPNLILTARHCLYEVQSERDATVHCDEPGREVPVLRAWKASSFSVHPGRTTPLSELVTGVKIYSGADLDLCQNDVALLEVTPPLQVRPLALRANQPPVPGEGGTIVGWGSSEEELETFDFPRLTEERRRREMVVEKVGPGDYTLPGGQTTELAASAFVGSEGACIGDSGAPFIAASGAVIGVANASQLTSRVLAIGSRESAGACVGAATLFQRIDLQGQWIREAFAEAGAMLWQEDQAGPAEFGAMCSAGRDCSSGVCVSAGASSFCSVACDDAPCPDGSTCVGNSGQRLCSLDEVAGLGTHASCALPAGARHETNCFLLSFAAMLALLGRRAAVAHRAHRGTARSAHH